MTEEDAFQVYSRHAAGYAERNHREAARVEYEWPMVRALLPDVTGRRVLDAGTGAGHYAGWLAEQGAEVVGIDASEGMLAQARERHGDRCTFQQADLREPLPFDSGEFQLVVCQLTLEHIRDWDQVLVELGRVLEADGQLVVSTAHPFSTYFVIEHEPPEIGSADATTADYYSVERYARDWGDEEPMWVPFFRRPLREVLRPVFEAGFRLADLREPAPDSEDRFLGYFDDETPRFLGLRARLDDD